MQVRLALMVVLFAVSACDQAPDDDNSRSVPPKERVLNSVQKDQSRRASIVTVYELQSAPAGPRQFSTKAQCEAARNALVEAQAKGDRKDSENSVPISNRPVPICVLL